MDYDYGSPLNFWRGAPEAPVQKESVREQMLRIYKAFGITPVIKEQEDESDRS
jgi:hypothetical protein